MERSAVQSPTRHVDFKLEIKMSPTLLKIPHEATQTRKKAYEAAQAREKPSNISFSVCVMIVLTLLAILSVATGVAPTVDPVVFPAP
jgi:hypothetical protein